MRRILVAWLMVLAPAIWADASTGDGYTMGADQWAKPRSGAALLALPPVHAAMAAWLQDPTARIVIQHAGSDTGSLWAGELQDWLVALGVPADHIGKRVSADQSENAVTLLVEH